jgi:hypothetical protein
MMFRGVVSRARGGHRVGVAVAAVSASLVSSAIVVGVSLASDHGQRAAAASLSPVTVKASPITVGRGYRLLQPGTIVRSSRLGVRAFIDDSLGVALNTGMSLNGVTYPVGTVNGGRTWRIDGPALHVPAANGPDAVTQIGAARPATFFAYGGPGGANSVDVSADGGRHWFRAFLGGGVVAAVVDSNGELFAFTGGGGAFSSTDGGRTWHATRSVS